jgi:predicted secreted protein
MKILRNTSLVLVFLCAFATVASAGDFATLNFIGFSKDGRYLAFEEYGVQDGSGFPYSNIYIVDVVKNIFAAKSVTVRIDNETATERLARSRARLGAASALKRFRIVAGNTGKLVVSRMLTDVAVNHFYSDKPEGEQKINFAEIIGSMYRGGDYDLILKQVPTKTKECAYADEDHTMHMLDVSVYDRERKRTVTLQKDSSLPPSRGCPFGYAIQYVYFYEDHLAVFLNTYHMGFEGPDMRYMVVTGKIK